MHNAEDLDYWNVEDAMSDMKHIIDRALKQHPDYSRLDGLSADVWESVRKSRKLERNSFHIPMGLQLGTIALCLIAILAVVQVSFQPDYLQADLFDLRFFSYESAPSLNFASVNTYEFTP